MSLTVSRSPLSSSTVASFAARVVARLPGTTELLGWAALRLMPAALVLAQLAGSGAALAFHRRQSPLKLVFNLAHLSLEAILASLLFQQIVLVERVAFGYVIVFLLGSFVALGADVAVGALLGLDRPHGVRHRPGRVGPGSRRARGELVGRRHALDTKRERHHLLR